MRLPKAAGITIAIMVVAFYVLAAWGDSTLTQQATTQEPPRTTYELPAQVAPYVSTLGLDTNLVQYMKVEVTPDGAKCSDGTAQNAAACMENGVMIWPQQMFATRPDQQYALFAHEYLHFVWAEITPAERQALSPSLEYVWANVPRFNKRLDTYAGLTSEDRYNEMQAYACTEIADWKLPQDLLNYCVKYIPNRSVLPSYY